MKTLLRILGAIVACVIVALVVLSFTGLDPDQRRPGLWLKGDVQSYPADWTFTDNYRTVLVETHPWYLIPHSVTILFVTYNGNLYLHADYPFGGKFPSGKSWTASVARDPNVRLKFGNQVFDCKAVAVTDPAESDAVFEATRKKSPDSPNRDVYFFRVLPE